GGEHFKQQAQKKVRVQNAQRGFCRSNRKSGHCCVYDLNPARTSNELHRDLALIAEKKKMKLNELVNKAFDFLVKNEDEVLQ
ncbi:hypothetical protein ACKWCC_18505, partial [Maribacter sp. 2307ULW6-5]